MGSDRMIQEKNKPRFRDRLNRLLNSVEEQHPFNKNNFVPAEKLVFLWIIGSGREGVERLLKMEIQRIVRDDRAIRILRSDTETIDSEEVYRSFYQSIDAASGNYLSVDMDNLMVCPIFLPGCFPTGQSSERFTNACVYLQEEMRKRHRYIEWCPYVSLWDENVDMSKTQLASVIRFMKTVIDNGYRNNLRCCTPCCVISDVNERSQEICAEQKAKIIVMLTVFRNIACENATNLRAILQPMAAGDDQYFFTARAISICEPVKSIALNRILAVHHNFTRGRDPQEKLFDNWKHTFFQGKIWRERLDGLAHDENYAVLTAPVYSNIPISDDRSFQETLIKFCNEYYFNPLKERPNQLMDEWWKAFWDEFFMQLRGSLKSLYSIEENREKILDKVPKMDVKRLDTFLTGDLRKGCEDRLVKELERQPRCLVEEAMRPEGQYMRKFRDKRDLVSKIHQEIESILHNQIVRLRQSELLLNTGGGNVADAEEEAEQWFQEYAGEERQRVSKMYGEYQSFLCRLFQSETDVGEQQGIVLLDLYEKVVSGSIESRESYMRTKLTKLAGTDMEQFSARLGESWLYPVRLIGNIVQDREQKLYMMGNGSNFLFRQIKNQGNYCVAYKEVAMDDRLEIVRISDRFTIQQIISDRRSGEHE